MKRSEHWTLIPQKNCFKLSRVLRINVDQYLIGKCCQSQRSKRVQNSLYKYSLWQEALRTSKDLKFCCLLFLKIEYPVRFVQKVDRFFFNLKNGSLVIEYECITQHLKGNTIYFNKNIINLFFKKKMFYTYLFSGSFSFISLFFSFIINHRRRKIWHIMRSEIFYFIDFNNVMEVDIAIWNAIIIIKEKKNLFFFVYNLLVLARLNNNNNNVISSPIITIISLDSIKLIDWFYTLI